MSVATTLEAVLKRDQAIVLAGLAIVCALAWMYLLRVATEMAGMDLAGAMEGMAGGARPAPWTAADFLTMFVMWAVMMAGMMLPGAAPMILLFAAINRKKAARGHAAVSTGLFAAGYLLAWTGFSLLAALVQWGLHAAALLSPAMVSTSPILGGLLFIAAGLWQWTPLKHACLVHCQSPLHFVTHHWREGAFGALAMGTGHGLYCLGCCWFLMGLLFAAGVMNLLWVAAIALFVLAEKVIRSERVFPRLAGTAMALYGLWLLFSG